MDKQLDSLKIPPHSVEAEQAVLGALMLENEAWDGVADRLSSDDFYRPEHRVIFRTLATLATRNAPFDVLVVSDFLNQQNQLKDAGGEAYLFELAKNTPTAANILAYSDIVRERSVLRQFASVANEIANSAFRTEGRTISELIDSAEQKVFKISDQGVRGQGPRDINTIMAHTIERMDELHKAKGAITGLTTGFTDLDERTSGLQPGDLIIVAARPSMGKNQLRDEYRGKCGAGIEQGSQSKSRISFFDGNAIRIFSDADAFITRPHRSTTHSHRPA